SCISTKSTLKNVDSTALQPALTKDKTYIITEISTDKNYGYNEDYPINLGFLPVMSSETSLNRYFGSLTGPQGQKITFVKVDSCCPFPSKNEMGAGIIDIYEVTWPGQAKPIRLHLNFYEKSKVMAPMGMGIRPVQ
ncbi:MAG: 2-dehydro-3-deoxyphosphooctonate aldolase, partial [Flavobacterium sp.]